MSESIGPTGSETRAAVPPSADVFVDHDGIYLLSHSVGLPVRGMRDAVAGALDAWEHDPRNAWPRWFETIDAFRQSLGELIGGTAASICPQSNVSSGLTKILGALDVGAERPTILLTEEAFPSLGYVCEHAGYDVRYIDGSENALDPAVWDRHLDGVDVVLITHVHSNTGELIPAAEVIATARRRDVVTIVDVAQSVGIIPIDVVEWDVDFVVGSCVKWLSGGPGAGWLWVRPELIDRCHPTDVGWFSHDDPFEFDIHDFRYAGDALRFWGGSPTVLPFAAAQHSIEMIGVNGVSAARQHNLVLSDHLIERLGDRVTSPHEATHRSGTCIVSAKRDSVDLLAADGIAVDHRLDGIRLSPHLFTSVEDLDIVIERLGKASSPSGPRS